MTVTILRNTFEGGTHNTAVTTGNSGGDSGDAINAVASLNYTNTDSAHGSLSAVSGGSGASARYAISGATSVAYRVYVKVPSSPGSDVAVARLSHTSDTTASNLMVNAATGALRIGSKGTLDSWTASNTFPINQWVRVEVVAHIGTDGTDGDLRVAYYIGDSTTPVEDSGTMTGLDLGGGSGVSFSQMRFTPTMSGMLIDDLGVNTNADVDGFIGPVANKAPVVTPGPDQNVAPSTNVTLSFTATDEDGVIASRETEFDYPPTGAPAISDGTTSEPKFTTGAKGNLYIVRHTATDDAGGQGSATSEVRVPVDGGATMTTLPMPATNKTGTWTVVGAATEGEALADSSDTSYVESGEVSGSSQRYRVRLQPSQVKSTGKITRRLGTDTGTAAATIRLYEGDTMREQWNQTVTSTPTNYEFTLAPATISNISDWGNLHVELSVVES